VQLSYEKPKGEYSNDKENDCTEETDHKKDGHEVEKDFDSKENYFGEYKHEIHRE
jgi:hypothetical protein